MEAIYSVENQPLLTMASDLLNIRVEYIHGSSTHLNSMFRFRKQEFILYSPSTVDTLCKELAHHYSLPADTFVIFHNGVKLGEKQRIVDRFTYHAQVEMTKGLGEELLIQPKTPFLPKTVHVDSDVYMDPQIEIETKPIKPLPIYFAFYHRHITYLVDHQHGAILSPHPRMRLGSCVVYVDWGRFQSVMASCPNVEPMTWMYDRLQRDFGITPTSSVFGVYAAPYAKINFYQSVVMQWLDKQEKRVEGEGEEDVEEDVEEDDIDAIDTYVDDSELWR